MNGRTLGVLVSGPRGEAPEGKSRCLTSTFEVFGLENDEVIIIVPC
jgi:hypothetical protein